jgi:hypothetical protein
MNCMKKLILITLTAGMLLRAAPASCQAFEAQQLLLDWAKLAQMKQILQDMYKGYQIVEQGYTAIRDISQGSFDLHKAFLDGLLVVSPAVRNYYKVAEIISYQLQIVTEYKQAYSRFRQDGHFSADEVSYIGQVYSNLFDKSVEALNSLITVLTDGGIRASDDERIKQIDGIHKDMQSRLSFLRSFNNRTALLSLQRSRDQDDVDMVKKLYGLE